MKIAILDTDEVGAFAASIVLRAIRDEGLRTLGVATGSSPLPLYDAMRTHAAELRHVRAFALDEYVGLPADHPQSYRSVIDREFTRPLGLDPAQVAVPDGASEDLGGAAADYERMIVAAGGIDLQVLGIGGNGHIAFNEPGSPLDSRTRPVALTARTRQDNARFFASLDEVPAWCLTQGVGTIMDARRVLLIARGASKAEAIAAAVEGPVGEAHPASVLQRHPDALLVLDHDAAEQLGGRAPRSETDDAALRR